MAKHVSIPVDDDYCPPAAADADPSSDDSDHDCPLREPEFLIHAVDERRPPPARVLRAPVARLPIQHHPPPRPDDDRGANGREEAARIERLRTFMLFPQTVFCAWTLLFGSVMIYFAANPGRAPDPKFTLLIVIVLSALVMLLALLSLLLSYLGVYVYDDCPWINAALQPRPLCYDDCPWLNVWM